MFQKKERQMEKNNSKSVLLAKDKQSLTKREIEL